MFCLCTVRCTTKKWKAYTPYWHNYYSQLKRRMQITLESLCTRKFMCSSVACCRGCCRLCVRTYHKFISSTAQASSCAMLYKSQIVKLHVLVCTCMCKQHGTFLPSQWRSTNPQTPKSPKPKIRKYPNSPKPKSPKFRNP